MGIYREKERKPLASSKGATVDIDALWKSMNDPSAERKGETEETAMDIDDASFMAAEGSKFTKSSHRKGTSEQDKTASSISQNVAPVTEETVTIKRTYIFAGEKITEQKSVPKSSAEARLYLQSQQPQSSTSTSSLLTPSGNHPPLQRPKKRISRFEPNPMGIVKGLSEPTLAWNVKNAQAKKDKEKQGPKLNVVEKSKLDWAGYVDKEGMKDELDVAEKAKDGYLSRQDFLGRVDLAREEELRSARMIGREVT